jgi:hypothetical protein
MSDERGRGRVDGTDEDEPSDPERRGLYERALPEVVRRLVERAVESGLETLTEGPEQLRRHLGEMKLPKEAAQYVYEQIDDTKKGVYRVVAKEIRDVLEHMNLAEELTRVLTKLSFEISTQIRFVPNPVGQQAEADQTAEPPDVDADDPPPKRRGRLPRPQVISKVALKARDRPTGSKE